MRHAIRICKSKRYIDVKALVIVSNKNIKVSRPFKFNNSLKIGDKVVGEGQPTLIIAE